MSRMSDLALAESASNWSLAPDDIDAESPDPRYEDEVYSELKHERWLQSIADRGLCSWCRTPLADGSDATVCPECERRANEGDLPDVGDSLPW